MRELSITEINFVTGADMGEVILEGAGGYAGAEAGAEIGAAIGIWGGPIGGFIGAGLGAGAGYAIYVWAS